MSDITPAIQQQLTQALSQLVKAQGDSPIARQAAQVIVQYLGGNQINLSIDKSGADKNSRTITLDKFASLPNSLKPGAYQGQLQSGQQGNQSANLALFPANSNSTSQTLLTKLNQSQLSSILAAISQDLQPGPQSKTQIVNAKVISVLGQQATFSANINGKLQNVTIRLTPLPSDLKVGQSVQLQLVPRGAEWQVNLLKASGQSSQAGTEVGESKRSVSPINTSPAHLDKASAATLLRNNPSPDVRADSRTSATIVTVDKNVLLAAITKTGITFPQQAIEQLNTLHAKDGQRINLVLNTPSSGEVRAAVTSPVATLQLSKQQVQQIQTLLGDTNVKQSLQKGELPHTPASQPSPSILASTIQAGGESGKTAAQNILEAEQAPTTLNTKDQAKAARELLAQMPPAQKSEVLKQLNEINRRLLPNTASPSESIENIIKGLSDQALLKESSTKLLIEPLIKQISQALPQGLSVDAENVKQLLAQPVLNLSPAQIVQPVASGQGLVAGLITLLQVSLASRLARTSAPQSEKIAQIVSSLVGASTKQTPAQTQRSLGDLQQIDQKHQLIKQLGRLFAQHQSTKLASVEQAMQGQEGLYYILPAGAGENKRDIELLIKREPDKNTNSKAEHGKNAVWHLTMKLDVGEIGQLLSKAKLRDTELELDLYTSNEALKTLVYEHLPLFKKRLQSLGIEVSKTLCQLGKIPKHLQSRPYQIFETQA